MPLLMAAVDADSRSHVLPAVLRQGLAFPRLGGICLKEKTVNTDRTGYDFCLFYDFSLLNRLTAIVKAQMLKVKFLKRGKNKKLANFQGNTVLLTLQTKQTLEQSLRKHRMLA